MPLEIFVASPCEEPWSAMHGDARVRFSQRCREHVFSLDALDEQEIRALVRANGGRVCARFFRRRDGTVLTRDCPRGVAALRRRAWRGLLTVAAVLVTLVLGRWRLGAVAGAGGGLADTRARLEARARERADQVIEQLRASRYLGGAVDALSPPQQKTVGRITTIRVIRGTSE